MSIAAKTEYACIAILELAKHFNSGEPVRIRRIADEHGIPSRFLVQILLQLKGAGIVSSTRGSSGGYQLVREPSSLSIAEIKGIIEGQSGTITSSASRETPVSRALLAVWNTAANAQQEVLQQTNFADLIDRLAEQDEQMYYI